MAGAGKLASLAEHLIDAGSAVAGCGPAFVDLFIEALADGGVACGLPRAQALEFAAQMVAGSAEAGAGERAAPRRAEGRGLLPRRHHHPGGAGAWRPAGFRGAVMEAVIAAYEKNGDLK